MDRLNRSFQLQKHDFNICQSHPRKIYWQIHTELVEMVFFSVNKI